MKSFTYLAGIGVTYSLTHWVFRAQPFIILRWKVTNIDEYLPFSIALYFNNQKCNQQPVRISVTWEMKMLVFWPIYFSMKTSIKPKGFLTISIQTLQLSNCVTHMFCRRFYEVDWHSGDFISRFSCYWKGHINGKYMNHVGQSIQEWTKQIFLRLSSTKFT